jgi:glycosyltransferase involved in cell wall biosynthesis
LIVIFYPEFGGVHGIARYLDSFLANLPGRAPPVVLITAGTPAGWQAPAGVELLMLPLRPHRLGLVWWTLQARAALARLERERGPALAVNLHVPPLIPALFFSRRRRIVLTAHTTYLGMSGRFDRPRNFDSPWNRLSVALKMAMERHILDRSAQVITLTEQGRQELARYGRHGGVVVIPNGVDTATFTEDPKVAQDIDVLFCGRIERRKGSRPLAEVCLRLLQARPALRICIVGYGDDEAHVRQRLAAAAGPDGPVRFEGRVPLAAMPELYRRSRLYASTSYYEGLPGTCLEAMATGVPAVVWNLPFYAGLVTDSCSGLLAPVNDLDGFTQRVLELIDQPERAAALGRQAANLVRRRHDWQRLAGQVVAACTPPGPASPRPLGVGAGVSNA